MSVRRNICETNGVFFITFTCARWLPLFKIADGYNAVYNWFHYLKKMGHHIVAYVMPNHVHVMIAFQNSQTPINTIIANGKRFMAYELVKRLSQLNKTGILSEMAEWVTKTDRLKNQRHVVFEPSFDWKECFSLAFMEQKVNYIHQNPCKARLVRLPEDYAYSSAIYYFTGRQGKCPVITYMQLQDINLTSSPG